MGRAYELLGPIVTLRYLELLCSILHLGYQIFKDFSPENQILNQAQYYFIV